MAGSASRRRCTSAEAEVAPTPAALLPRRNLDELRELFLGQRRRRELERDSVLDDDVEPDDLVGIDRSLGKKVVARALSHSHWNAHELGVRFELYRSVAEHPID